MKKFIKNNQEFICIHCGQRVLKHSSSSRDHCNHCLYGLHVDINPGDRLNNCKGILEPIGLRIFNGKKQIVYKCEKCSKLTYCIMAEDDNKDEVIKMSNMIWQS